MIGQTKTNPQKKKKRGPRHLLPHEKNKQRGASNKRASRLYSSSSWLARDNEEKRERERERERPEWVDMAETGEKMKEGCHAWCLAVVDPNSPPTWHQCHYYCCRRWWLGLESGYHQDATAAIASSVRKEKSRVCGGYFGLDCSGRKGKSSWALKSILKALRTHP